MRDRFGAVVFFILNVLLFPGTLIGYVIRLGKGVLTRPGRVRRRQRKGRSPRASSSTSSASGETSRPVD
jgi:hypothetical protein